MINWSKIARFCCRRMASKLDALGRFYLMKELADELRPDYRFKWPQMDWWQDDSFNAYLRRFDEAGGMNTDRRWMLRELLRLVDAIPGDTAECGVFAGASSHIICQANQWATHPGKIHHLFDSFAGLSKPGSEDGDHWAEGDLAYGVDQVRANLSEFERTAYYPGWIPERFHEVEDRQFSFVHIDVDLMEPTRDSIAFFYPRMADGGVIVIDDYGFTSCPGATRAADEFLAGRPEQMLRLSGGGGFLVKGIRTAQTTMRKVAA